MARETTLKIANEIEEALNKEGLVGKRMVFPI